MYVADYPASPVLRMHPVCIDHLKRFEELV